MIIRKTLGCFIVFGALLSGCVFGETADSTGIPAEEMIKSSRVAASETSISREREFELTERLDGALGHLGDSNAFPGIESIQTLAVLLHSEMDATLKCFAGYINALHLTQNINGSFEKYNAAVTRYKGVVRSIARLAEGLEGESQKEKVASTLNRLTKSFGNAIDHFKDYSLIIWNGNPAQAQTALSLYRQALKEALAACSELENLKRF